MDRISLLLLLVTASVALGYLLHSRWLLIGRGLLRRSSRDVRLDLYFHKDFETGLPEVMVAAPFIDEKSGWSIGVRRRGIQIGYTATATMHQIITGLLHDHCLLQVMLDDATLPSRTAIHERGLRPFEHGIVEHDGILVHTPDSMANGSLEKFFSGGTDIFILYPQVTPPSITKLTQLAAEIREGSIKSAIRAIGARGALLNLYEVWRLSYADTNMLRDFASRLADAAAAKLFRINGLSASGVDRTELRLPIMGELFVEYDTGLACSWYLEEDLAVLHWRRGGRYDSVAVNVPALVDQNEGLAVVVSLRRWLVPQLVSDRVYTRQTLLRFFVQYLFTAMYMTLLAMGAARIGEWLFGNLSMPVQLTLTFCGALLAVLCLALSINYLARAIFGGKHLLHRAGL